MRVNTRLVRKTRIFAYPRRDRKKVAQHFSAGMRFFEHPSRRTSELVRQDFLADVINKIGRELSRGF
jgi:hypothetical protein